MVALVESRRCEYTHLLVTLHLRVEELLLELLRLTLSMHARLVLLLELLLLRVEVTRHVRLVTLESVIVTLLCLTPCCDVGN